MVRRASRDHPDRRSYASETATTEKDDRVDIDLDIDFDHHTGRRQPTAWHADRSIIVEGGVFGMQRVNDNCTPERGQETRRPSATEELRCGEKNVAFNREARSCSGLALASLFGVIALAGCALEIDDAETSLPIQGLDKDAIEEGEILFDTAPAVSNGTACVHCHDPSTGTLNPEQIEELDPGHPLFQFDRRDFDANFTPIETFEAFRAHATIAIDIALPGHVVVDATPSIRTVFFRRGIPSTTNLGLADDVVMQDGRFDSLETQAVLATEGHAEATLTTVEREARRSQIPIFERDAKKKRAYSWNKLFWYVRGGAPPPLPNGPGSSFFEPGGACAECHGGPALNTTAGGERFADNGSAEANALNNRVFTFTFTNADNSTVDIVTADAGRALISGTPDDANKFKIPSLFNVANTAPYFHDNSASTLEEAVSHYADAGIVELSDEDIEDILMFLEQL